MSNWPLNADRSGGNWTGRTKRHADWGGHWAPDSHEIPLVGWLGALAVVALFTFFSLAGQVYYIFPDSPPQQAEERAGKTMYATKE